MNIQIIKKRLKELKLLSENIKISTANSLDDEHNLDLVRLIIHKTKSISIHPYQSTLPITSSHQQVTPQGTKSQAAGSRQHANNHHASQALSKQQLRSQKYISRLTKIQSKSYQQEENQQQQQVKKRKHTRAELETSNTDNRPKKTNSKDFSVLQKEDIEMEEIMGIVEENKNLTHQLLQKDQDIRQLRDQIEKLSLDKDRISLMVSEQAQSQYKQLSYFKIDLTAKVFATYIFVHKHDYSRIEYQLKQLTLRLDHIKIGPINSKKKPVNGSVSSHQHRNSSNINGYNSIKKDKEHLDISDLVGVEYIDDLVLQLKFRQDDSKHRYLYIKFENNEQKHQWDLGLYINFILLKNLANQDLFKQNNVFNNLDSPQIMQQTDRIQQRYRQLTKSRQIGEDQSQLIRQYIKQEERYKSMEKIIMDNKLHTKFKLFQSRSSHPTSKQRYSNTIDMDNINRKLVYENASGRNSGYRQSRVRSSQAANQLNILRQKQAQELAQKQRIEAANKQKLIQQQKEQQRIRQLEQAERQEKLKQQAEQELKRQKKQKEQKKRQQLVKKRQELKKLKSFLKNGVFLTKYAEGAFNPYIKRVYLSADQQKLCWHNKGQKEKQSKSIMISDIVSINKGEIGPGIEKHIGKQKIKSINQFVVLKLKDKNRKMLQFGCVENEKLVASFSTNLTNFIESKQNNLKIDIQEQQSIMLF